MYESETMLPLIGKKTSEEQNAKGKKTIRPGIPQYLNK